MFKKIIRLICILAAVGLAFAMLDLKGEYAAQRKLYSAGKLFTQIAKNPESIPEGLYKKGVSYYEHIIRDFPKTRSEREARLILSKLYTLQKKFTEARAELAKILKIYPDDKNYCAQAQFATGNTYEQESKWQEALSVYEGIMKDYIGTKIALNTPLYIAGYYAKNKDEQNKKAYLEKAYNYYKKLSEQYTNTVLGYLSMSYEVTVLESLGNWDKALKTLSSIIDKYPNDPAIIDKLRAIELVAILKLQNPQQVITIYNDFMTKYPQHKVNKLLEKQITKIKEAMEKKKNDIKPDK